MICKEGFDFSFNEEACKDCGGKCCIGEPGNVFVNEWDIEKLSSHFKLERAEFIKKYLRKVGVRYSFKEVHFEDGFACVFFDQQNKQCQIYDLRPKQCRLFPFWDYYKKHKEELKKECIGVCF